MTAADLTFVETPHGYHLPDGRRVPSVTEILRAVGVSEDFAHANPEDLEFRRQLGTEVHRMAHAFDDDDVDWDTVDPRVRPYLDAWAAWRINAGAMPVQRERRVFHPGYFYAGTLDGIFELANGTRILCDIKSSDLVNYASNLQVAAYEMAWQLEHRGERIDERWIVHLTPNCAVPYRVINCSAEPTAWMDGRRFLACVTVFHLQGGRR